MATATRLMPTSTPTERTVLLVSLDEYATVSAGDGVGESVAVGAEAGGAKSAALPSRAKGPAESLDCPCWISTE